VAATQGEALEIDLPDSGPTYSINWLLAQRSNRRTPRDDLGIRLEDAPKDDVAPARNNKDKRLKNENRPIIGVVTEVVGGVNAEVLARKRDELKRIENETTAEIKSKPGLRGYSVMISGTPAVVEKALPLVELALLEEVPDSMATATVAAYDVPARKLEEVEVPEPPLPDPSLEAGVQECDWDIPTHWALDTAVAPGLPPSGESWARAGSPEGGGIGLASPAAEVPDMADEGFWESVWAANELAADPERQPGRWRRGRVEEAVEFVSGGFQQAAPAVQGQSATSSVSTPYSSAPPATAPPTGAGGGCAFLGPEPETLQRVEPDARVHWSAPTSAPPPVPPPPVPASRSCSETDVAVVSSAPSTALSQEAEAAADATARKKKKNKSERKKAQATNVAKDEAVLPVSTSVSSKTTHKDKASLTKQLSHKTAFTGLEDSSESEHEVRLPPKVRVEAKPSPPAKTPSAASAKPSARPGDSPTAWLGANPIVEAPPAAKAQIKQPAAVVNNAWLTGSTSIAKAPPAATAPPSVAKPPPPAPPPVRNLPAASASVVCTSTVAPLDTSKTPKAAMLPKAKVAMKAKEPPVPKANPLPQRGGVQAGVATSFKAATGTNSATSGKWFVDRPVEKVIPASMMRYEEELDPEMACYLWDRKTQAPRGGPTRAAAAPAPVPPAIGFGPPPRASAAPNSQRQRQLIGQVMEMGFDEQHARRALPRTGWNVEDAVVLLCA
jgi:hypothetical protein